MPRTPKLDARDPLHQALLGIVIDTLDHDRTGEHARVSWSKIRTARERLVAAGIDARVLDTLESLNDAEDATDATA